MVNLWTEIEQWFPCDTVLSSHTGIYPHLDDKDVITCIITLGDVLKGGSTVYYSGLKEKDPHEPDLSVSFGHGRIQIGSFSKVVHGVDEREGNQITLKFCTKFFLLVDMNDKIKEFSHTSDIVHLS